MFWSVITLCTDSTANRFAISLWSCGNPQQRLLAVIDVAARIMHELQHVCGQTHHADCRERVFPAQNTFRWGLLQRYPNAMTTVCGKANFGSGTQRVSDEMFMSRVTWQIAETGSCHPSCDGEEGGNDGGNIGGGGWDTSICRTCPWLCAGMAPKQGNSKDDFARCFVALVEEFDDAWKEVERLEPEA